MLEISGTQNMDSSSQDLSCFLASEDLKPLKLWENPLNRLVKWVGKSFMDASSLSSKTKKLHATVSQSKGQLPENRWNKTQTSSLLSASARIFHRPLS